MAAQGGYESSGSVSQVAENLYITMPGGATIAAMLHEINWQLGVAKIQGFIGVTT